MKFVDVKNDLAFRKIFGNENRKESLISFLNAVLTPFEAHIIVDVEILNPYQLPEFVGGKVTIVDIKAKDKSGKSYIVNMQVTEDEGFSKRVLYYVSKSYTSQIDRGELYDKLNPTFFIGILDFTISKNTHYLSRHRCTDIEIGEVVLKDIEFNFIELPKFNKEEKELTSIIDQWVYFIKNAGNLELIPEDVEDIGLKSAYNDALIQNWTKNELEQYDKIFMREGMDKGVLTLALKRNTEETQKIIALNLIKKGGFS